ncbi:MAG: hypothetical protein CNCCGFBP_02342 [Fimbriimonadaceae bacterium]|nr:hypothetical protein [Fimbriimonadaceae bacterium]
MNHRIAVAPVLLLGVSFWQPTSQDLRAEALHKLRLALGSGIERNLQTEFARAQDSAYLIEMAGRRGGLTRVGVKVIPTPPGWPDDDLGWAVFHAFHGIQSDHDPLHTLIRAAEGPRVGREIAEAAPQSSRVRHASLDVTLLPSTNQVRVSARLDLERLNGEKAPVFRLNDAYVLSKASVNGEPARLVVASSESAPELKQGDVVQAGGIVVVWSSAPVRSVELEYVAKLSGTASEKVTSAAAYVTSNWVPTLGRQPMTTTTRITHPEEWLAFSEGEPADPAKLGFPPRNPPAGMRIVAFKNDLPISFPKVVAGPYQLAAETEANGKPIRAYHLGPPDAARGKQQVDLLRRGMEFMEARFGAFPYSSYSLLEADTYYGIESYSYTLLNRSISTRFPVHELVHTWFGGMAPCSYTKDTWNEGVTQYVDSVLFDGNRDGTLQGGLRTLDLAKPLSQMALPHLDGSATYFRGAFVMKALEAEIGLEAVLAGLKALAAKRRGLDTTWADLRPFFEEASGKDLAWFWRQWIENATFPMLQIVEAQKVFRDGSWGTWVQVRQTGVPTPFRLRIEVTLSAGTKSTKKVVEMSKASELFRIDSDFEPTSASLNVMGYALARTGEAVPIRK